MQTSYVYIITNKYRTTFYIGVTSNLHNRILEHRKELKEGFSSKYVLHDLIYFEEYIDINQAIAREKQLKNWKKEWKLSLIKKINPELKNLEL